MPRSSLFFASLSRALLPGLALTGLLACEGVGRVQLGSTPGAVPTPPAPIIPSSPDEPLVCPDAPAGRLEDVRAYFAEAVHPMLVRESGGCMGCHADGQRQFRVTASAEETFALGHAGGFLGLGPSSLVGRLRTSNEAARMPQDAAPWATVEVEAAARVACALQAIDEEGNTPAADEVFPPHLLSPYEGPASTDYDNTFLSHAQLRGRVQQVFADDWVREGKDLFAENLGLFGGVDFQTRFVPARAATAEFLLGLDLLAPDVCARAVSQKSGPFTGLDVDASLVDHPGPTSTLFQAETAKKPCTEADGPACITASTGGKTADGWNIWANGSLSVVRNVTYPGDFQVTVRARQTSEAGSEPARMRVALDGAAATTFDVPGLTYSTFMVTFPAVAVGTHTLSVSFTNDFNDSATGADRNLVVDAFTFEGPLGESTGTARHDAMLAGVDGVHLRMLYRHASAGEQEAGAALLREVEALALPVHEGWAALCEALVRHPDFLFTRPPSTATATGEDRQRLLLVKLAQDLVARPPTPEELQRFLSGRASFMDMASAYLHTEEFTHHFFEKMRVRTESDGTGEADEPARLWTYLVRSGRPFDELLTADYGVDAALQPVGRPAFHGRTGVLTMPGFIRTKQGLPHYNYAARVLTDFMGTIFEVPPEVFDMRGTATASSTVDPSSTCYSCHRLLTPLSHQRLRWDDTGGYHETDEAGLSIDDSDRGMVADYPYKGEGMEAFATQAVKKEAFRRRTLNVPFSFLFGRELRHEADERGLYKELWDVAEASGGSLEAVFLHILQSPAYRGGELQP